MNQKLAIIILAGVVTGMVLSAPTLFMSQVLTGGLVVGFFAGVIGFFVLRRKTT